MSDSAKHIEIDKELLKKHDSVVFHVAKPKMVDGELIRGKHVKNANDKFEFVADEDGKVQRETPTHTFGFAKAGDNIIMVYGVARPGFDSFSKRDGKRIVEERLTLMINRIENFDRKVKDITPEELAECLPYQVIDSLDHYANKAAKYYELTGEEVMFFRGDKRDNRCFAVPLFTEVDNEDDPEETAEEVVEEATKEVTATDYIFCTRAVGECEYERIEIVINRTTDFLSNGISLKNDNTMIEDLGDLVAANDIYPEDDQACILFNDDLREDEIVNILRQYGFTYSQNLENAYSDSLSD